MAYSVELDSLLVGRGVGALYPLGVMGSGDSFIAGHGLGASLFHRVFWGGERRLGLNVAAGGKRADQILAEQLPSILAVSGPGRVVVNGGINDLAQGVPETTLRASLVSIWAQLKNGGKQPFDVGMPPSDVSFARALAFADHELWRQQYCMRNGIPHLNIWPSVSSPSGGFAAGMGSGDLTHLSAFGQDICAAELVKLLDRPSRLSPFMELIDRAASAANPLPNAVSFGGVQVGTKPAGYNAPYPDAGSTITPSVVAPDPGDFGNWLTYNWPSAQQPASGFSGTACSLSDMGWAVGDRVAFSGKLRWTAATITPTVRIAGMNNASFIPMQDEKGSGGGLATAYFYAETVVSSGLTVLPMFTASSTGAGVLAVQRPKLFNITKAGLLA